jgi:hypothetical protein
MIGHLAWKLLSGLQKDNVDQDLKAMWPKSNKMTKTGETSTRKRELRG